MPTKLKKNPQIFYEHIRQHNKHRGQARFNINIKEWGRTLTQIKRTTSSLQKPYKSTFCITFAIIQTYINTDYQVNTSDKRHYSLEVARLILLGYLPVQGSRWVFAYDNNSISTNGKHSHNSFDISHQTQASYILNIR